MPVYHKQNSFPTQRTEPDISRETCKEQHLFVGLVIKQTDAGLYVIKQIQMYLCYKTDNIQIIYLLQNIIEECDKKDNLSMASHFALAFRLSKFNCSI